VSYVEDLSFVTTPDTFSFCLNLGMASNFVALPCELQEQVLCDLPTEALKSVRLACAPLNRCGRGVSLSSFAPLCRHWQL